MPKKYIALIPAYKPSELMLTLVHRLHADGFSIVIVNDGSGEEFQELFANCMPYGVVLSHPKNAGKGRALKTGLAYIAEHFEQDIIVVTVDADGQHKAEDALAVCRLAEKSYNTLVLGSRKLKGNIPFRSRLGNTITRLVYMLITGLRVHDTQTGLRAFHASLIPALLKVPGDRYEYEMNMLLHFSQSKIKILEHDIETIYIDDNAHSHFSALKDSFRIYKEILKFSAASFTGFIVDYVIFSLLTLLTNRLYLSNIVARIISATVNFSLNRKFVFRSKESLLRSAIKYFSLALVILISNTLVLEFLVHTCAIHQMIAKIITEIFFFILSWLVQRLVVFKEKK